MSEIGDKNNDEIFSPEDQPQGMIFAVKFKILGQITFFGVKFQFCGSNFICWGKFNFLGQISFFGVKFQFCGSNFCFWVKFHFLGQISFFGQISVLWVKFHFLGQISFFGQISFLVNFF